MEFEFEMEPEPDAGEVSADMARVALAEPTSLATLLPNFPLHTLLAFVPDVRLKQRIDAAAEAALAVDVAAPGGLLLADEKLALVRAAIKDAERCFEEPTSLANQLHKRMTGLRADFCAGGAEAVETVGRRIYDEKKRLDALAAEERRKAQALADQQAREAAAAAAKDAKKTGAPAPVVEALKQQAKTATAPPVSGPIETPTLRHSTAVENWKARVAGTPPGEEPHPAISDMTREQLAQVLRLMQDVVAGKAPMAAFELNWPLLDKRANAERGAFALSGLEAYDAGGVRGKARR